MVIDDYNDDEYLSFVDMHGTSPTSIFTAGAISIGNEFWSSGKGHVFHYDGANWKLSYIHDNPIWSIWSVSEKEYFFHDFDQEVYHYTCK